MISPYTSSTEFELETAKMEIVGSITSNVEKAEVDVASFRNALEQKVTNIGLTVQKKVDHLKTVDLSGLKYNIESHLGS